jgi:hypothetical protein
MTSLFQKRTQRYEHGAHISKWNIKFLKKGIIFQMLAGHCVQQWTMDNSKLTTKNHP